jgi:hypothetical protein
VNLDTSRNLDVGGGHRTCGVLGKVCDHRSVVLRGNHQVLDVKDYLNNVFLDTWDGGELVRDTLNADVGNSSSRNGA